MTLTTLLPAAVGADNGGTQVGGASKVAAVQTADDATSYVTLPNGSSAIQGFYVDALPAGVGAISLVEHKMRAASGSGAGQGTPRFRLGASTTDGTTRTPGGSWISYSESLARPGGSAYSAADFPGGGAGLQVVALWVGGSDEFAMTYMAIDVTWTPEVGGFVCMVGSLVGAALGLAEMAKLAHTLHQLTRTLITPDEYEAAWRDIRGHRHRRTFLMAA